MSRAPELVRSDASAQVKKLSVLGLKTLLERGGNCVVMYTADGCVHCENAKPELNKLNGRVDHVSIARHDARLHPVYVNGQQVARFPTTVFYNGNPEEVQYEGPHEVAPLASAVLAHFKE